MAGEIIDRVFESFIGETEQIPPMLVKGKRLYQYARGERFFAIMFLNFLLHFSVRHILHHFFVPTKNHRKRSHRIYRIT